jgi:hypothetical protein
MMGDFFTHYLVGQLHENFLNDDAPTDRNALARQHFHGQQGSL